MSTNTLAARAIATYAANPAEARLFLNMLGLLNGDQIASDDTKPHPLGKANVPMTRAAMLEYNARPKVSTAPAALRVLPDLPKVTKPRAPRSAAQNAGPLQDRNRAIAAPCGTETAAKRHKRNGEPLCTECVAGREARKVGRVYTRAACGTPSAYQTHMRYGEPVDQACRDAYNADRRSKSKPNSRKKAAA